MAIGNMHTTFGKVWTCGSRDVHVDRQRQTEMIIIILHSLPGME